MLSNQYIIGVISSGAVGSGIAHVAPTAGHLVYVYDNNQVALSKAEAGLKASLQKLLEKQKISAAQQESILAKVRFVSALDSLSACHLVIEAIVENLEVKRSLFAELEKLTGPECILASNTSSLSITSIAAACGNPERVMGILFFNPATLMPLVEIIPGIATPDEAVK